MTLDNSTDDLEFTQDFEASPTPGEDDTVARNNIAGVILAVGENNNEIDGDLAQSVAFTHIPTTFPTTFENLSDLANLGSVMPDSGPLLLSDASDEARPTASFLGTSAPDQARVTYGDSLPTYVGNGAVSQQHTPQAIIPAITTTSPTQEDLPPVTVAASAAVEIDGASAQSVTFTGTTGTLTLDNALGFTGQITGLTGSDALDLADVSYGPNTTATFLGTADGGTLTVSDGTHTALIALVGDYLSSSWTLSRDGDGGTVVVDPVATNSWQTLNVGDGGWATGIDIAPDDTMVVRTDTYGAYIWNGAEWQQLVTATSMPAAFVTTIGSQGVYEIQIAPSNSDVLYMMYEGHVLKSTNKGNTWTETSFAAVTESPNDAYRIDGQKMAVDPENSNVVYVGTPQNGLFVTTNGGSSWQSVSAVPISLTNKGLYPGITGIEFDPALGVVGGITQTIFAASYGNGVYESVNGGDSWSSIGGPSNVEYAAVSNDGVYYAVANNNTQLWSYSHNAWSELLSSPGGNQIQTVAIDPFNPNEIIVTTPGGNLNESLNGGATWSGWNWENKFAATDVPWLANTGAGMSIGGLAFDQLIPNKLWASAGVGVWDTSVPQNLQFNTPVDWNSQSAGIEQLVANEIIVPPGGDPVLASWDRAFISIANSDVYPTTYGPVDGKFAAGWSIDYASSNPSFLVGIADWWGNEESGYSTNGGQTWTAFPSFIPGAGTNFMGGTIAASSSTDIIWAPAGGLDPYYTLNGGETWNPIVLPGVSNWSGFDTEYYYDTRTITADRVLPNTFYLYYAGQGVFESTNGGSTWTKVFSGQISPYSYFNAELQSVPGEAGNLFFTGGPQSGFTAEKFYQSVDQGATWTAVPNVTEVDCFGFGASAPGQSYPSIYIVGSVNNVYGIWQSINDAQSWTQIGTYPTGVLAEIKTISGNPNVYGEVYVGFAGAGYAYLTTGPAVTGVTTSPAIGIEFPRAAITLTVNLNEAVTVANGTPTLTLNDGGTATYSGGSGTDALTFNYTVAAGQNTPDLAVTAVNLGTTTVTDAAGNAANLAGAVTTFSGLQIDTTVPTVSSVAMSGSGISNGSGILGAGHVVTLTVNLNEAVTVANGTPTLTLNDGGTATYTGGSGSNALTFSYTVAAGQNTPDLAVTAINLGTATLTDAAGNAANLAGAVGSLAGTLQIGTAVPTVSSVAASGNGIANGNGDLNAGHVVTLAVSLSEAVTVANGTPTLTLNDGGTATYSGGSGTNALTFSYTVAAGQNTPDLAVTAINLGTATVTDAAGNAANLSGAISNLAGTLQIDTTVPTASSVAASGGGITNGNGDLNAGHVVTLTVNLSEAVTIVNGTPTLTLNDGGTATYAGGTGTDALTFSYTVAAGQNTPDLAVTAINLGTATVTDAAGNTANLSGAISNLTGTLQIGTAAPTVSSVAASGSGITNGNGDLNAGHLVTLVVNLSEAVTVVNGTPTLTLNDGGTATYSGGTGTNALTFSYTVAAGQNTPDLAVTAINLGTATVTDAAGNAANLSGAVGNLIGTLQVGAAAPAVITSVTAAPASGDVESGDNVTVTLIASGIVDVTGTPVLSLNDGGAATYTGGAGTNTLTFSYTVATGQNTTALQLTGGVTGGTITDAAGNPTVIAPTTLGLQVNTDHWLHAVSNMWSTTSDWSSPAGAPATFDLVMLDAVGTYTVSTGVDKTIAELNTISTATLAIGAGAVTVTNGTGSGIQAGTIDIYTGATFEITGTFDNTGTIAPSGTGNIEIVGSATLSGNGNITLSDSSNDAIVTNGAAATLTNVGNTISGAGVIGDSHLTLVNDGAIIANKSNPLTINTGNNTTTNSGTLEATSSGTLFIDSNVNNSNTIEALGSGAKVVIESEITNTPTGLILASGAGAQVDLDNATIMGGTLQTGSGALIETISGSNDVLNGANISSGSIVEANSGTTLALEGTVGNAGTLLANGGTLQIYGALAGGTTEIGAHGSVVIHAASSENVNFLAGSTGELALDQTTDYTGEISGFGANTSQSIDLTDINFATAQFSYAAASGASGGLTVADGINSVHLQLEGTYTLANFDIASDGHGGTLLTDPAVITQASGNAPAFIADGTVLEINTADHGAVTFGGPTGTLWLDQPSTFTATVNAFGAHDVIDLPGIAFGADTALQYAAEDNGGKLTVSDGAHAASLSLLGNYTAASFALSSDGHGGTLIAEGSLAPASAPLDASGANVFSGSVTFADPEPSNTQTATFSARDPNYVGTFSVDGVSESNVPSASVGFNFALGNDQINLAPGQILTQSYDVTVADARNPAENLNQTVSVSIGGPGHDTFVFAPGIGADTIANFNPQNDKIELDHFTNVQTIQELSALITNDAHGDAMINLGHNDSITLPGMTGSELHQILTTAVHLH